MNPVDSTAAAGPAWMHLLTKSLSKCVGAGDDENQRGSFHIRQETGVNVIRAVDATKPCSAPLVLNLSDGRQVEA